MSNCCGCADLASDDEYDKGLHVGAIFILFAVSAAETMLPVLSNRLPVLSAHSIAMEWLLTFGFGVVISTDFIHMMNEGVEMLSNPCLGAVIEDYESLGMAVVLATIVMMHLIECESAVYFAGKAGAPVTTHGHVHGVPVNTASSAVVLTPNDEESMFQLHADKAVAAASGAKTDYTRKLAAVLFEVGVAFHSVIVGVDIGVTAGTEFKTLLAAICFHQFFEGVAISGSALGAVERLRSVLAMNFAFAITTPAGVVIEMAIRSTYSSTSVTALWVQGVLNCVAGGVLLYTGLVQLLTYHMTTNQEFISRSSSHRFLLYSMCWLGAGAVALIGKWV